eukprot:6821838-Prymnesium_polylepis.1
MRRRVACQSLIVAPDGSKMPNLPETAVSPGRAAPTTEDQTMPSHLTGVTVDTPRAPHAQRPRPPGVGAGEFRT